MRLGGRCTAMGRVVPGVATTETVINRQHLAPERSEHEGPTDQDCGDERLEACRVAHRESLLPNARGDLRGITSRYQNMMTRNARRKAPIA
jgi:hypothetical protein